MITNQDILFDIIDSDIFKRNGVTLVLVGSLAFELHGLLPQSYIPGDIDIICFADKDSFAEISEYLYHKYLKYRETIKTIRDLRGISIQNHCYIYEQNNVLVNVWLKPDSEIGNKSIVTMLVGERKINTFAMKDLFAHKLGINRHKDLEFVTQIFKEILTRRNYG